MNRQVFFSTIDFIFPLLARLRIVAYVWNPFLANIKAISQPIPLEPPVTTATRMLSPFGLLLFLLLQK